MTTEPRTRWPESVFDGKENWRWFWWDSEDTSPDGGWSHVEELVHRLKGRQIVSFDTEATGLEFTEDRIVAMSFAWHDDHGVEQAVTVMCDDGTDWTGPIMAPLVDWLEDASAKKALANGKFDTNILHFHDVELRGIEWDTMLMSQLADQHEQLHNVDVMTQRHLGLRKIATEVLIGKGKKSTGWGPVPREVMAEYANEDVVAVLRLLPIMIERLHQSGQMRTWEEIERPDRS